MWLTQYEGTRWEKTLMLSPGLIIYFPISNHSSTERTLNLVVNSNVEEASFR